MINESSVVFYAEVWTNEYPESAGHPGISGKFTKRNNTVLHCTEGYKYHENGNHLDVIYLKVDLYEYKESLDGNHRGRPLDSARWDGLECFNGYNFVVAPDGAMQLFECRRFCDTPQEREGLEPMPKS